ncbi:P1 family peptidase [Wenzhouxiangella sp. XN201]|uniref:DmpA family aminopeptidase n=1 Tax=Wenzhouxiangella sp. XN201 TaxID=2710755 RepID=UPI0013C977DE|nr:P1 family peptidase [Wenzhouxiangella sp. XN201]NEZ04384.1 P1 family peptidase [Wenzhouxiangella sp. XN201]
MLRVFCLPLFLACLLIPSQANASAPHDDKGRARDLGLSPGILTPGRWNAITDVAGVAVGHHTLIEGESIRTGVTAVLPHGANPYRERVPAAVYVGNGFGKAVGFTQIRELGEIETPIALSNTLSVYQVAHGVADYVLELPGNEDVRSVNAVAGETNDGWLNDIRARVIDGDAVARAIEAASSGPVAEGNVGAGTGTRALGFKAGIGTSSRVLPAERGGHTVGVLVQSNFGGVLSIDGVPVGERLGQHFMVGEVPYERPASDSEPADERTTGYDPDVDGSIMIVVATDAPLTSRNLERLARRAMLGLARTGGFSSNGSGDYVIAFSTHEAVRIHVDDADVRTVSELSNAAMSPLFLAVVEATEEAILNSLFMAETMTGHEGRTMPAIPLEKVVPLLEAHGAIETSEH